MVSHSSEPRGVADLDRRLAITLGILEGVAVMLVLLAIIAGQAGGKTVLSVNSEQLVLVGTWCLIGAPVLALLPLTAHFLSDKSKTGWYALGTLAITVVGVLLAAR